MRKATITLVQDGEAYSAAVQGTLSAMEILWALEFLKKTLMDRVAQSGQQGQLDLGGLKIRQADQA